MMYSGIVEADHHQFVVGSPAAETYEPSATGSVMEIGTNFVTIKTGAAHGAVAVDIVVLDGPPEEPGASEGWEVIEEATITINKPLRVARLDGALAPDFPKLPVSRGLNMFRVSARGRDSQWDMTVTDPTESFFVQIWKATQPVALRRLLKTDAAWHDDIVTHKSLNFWDPDPARDATLYLEYGYDQMATWAKEEAIRWGGRPPTDKLSRTPYADEFAALDRMLVDALARTRAPKLLKIAAWAARRAYTNAGIADIDWIRDGLEALDNGIALPRPFDTRINEHVWNAFQSDPRIEMWITTDAVGTVSSPAQLAIYALTEATFVEEPLRAVFNVLRTAALTDNYDIARLIADLRHEFFPKLAPADQYERWIGFTVDDVL